MYFFYSDSKVQIRGYFCLSFRQSISNALQSNSGVLLFGSRWEIHYNLYRKKEKRHRITVLESVWKALVCLF